MADGVTVVDAKNPGWGQPILDKIKELTDKPVVRLINTHTHADHVSGNVEFPATIDIVTQENTKANMEKMVAPSGFPPATSNIFKERNGRGMPKENVQGQNVHWERRRSRGPVLFWPRTHKRRRVGCVSIAGGDARGRYFLRQKTFPLLDANNGGSGMAIPDTLQKAFDTVKNVDVIITGHSPR